MTTLPPELEKWAEGEAEREVEELFKEHPELSITIYCNDDFLEYMFLAGVRAMWGRVVNENIRRSGHAFCFENEKELTAEITRLKGEVEELRKTSPSGSLALQIGALKDERDELRAEVEKLKHWRSIFMEWEKLLDPYAEKVHADLVRDLLRDRKREQEAARVLEEEFECYSIAFGDRTDHCGECNSCRAKKRAKELREGRE